MRFLRRARELTPNGSVSFALERVEQAQIWLKVRGDQMTPDIQEQLLVLSREFEDIELADEDSLSVTYDFAIEYRDVVRQLRAILALLENAELWADVSLFEKSGGGILIQEVIDALRAVQATIEARG